MLPVVVIEAMAQILVNVVAYALKTELILTVSIANTQPIGSQVVHYRTSLNHFANGWEHPMI
jgi:uncharacterized membrane protein